ncbi:hypothetical protein JCM19239_6306 [Vibrio variabilis]|uniref:Uncharacterized protein n=1 Tax=Vibrio variabilis TaxID=990271 RepID=A0ABQ0J9I1_9VIBR|nr:hypothetical protein JCM19239_6306 [Vibrio variabilis]
MEIRFYCATLEEEIELIQGLNQTLGYDIGIYRNQGTLVSSP